ncbi:MAG: TetR/AcrR family transcriptional regulator [Acidiferrobacterales bacterium]|nr:TetR/AcrR family transcriptional regulator [Acidiferrobacterales bacterium]
MGIIVDVVKVLNIVLVVLKSRYKKSEEIREKLLDTAELLFAQRGFFGVSIRDITELAGVRSASINYHFESKKNLFMEVVDRRIEPLAAARLDALSAIELKRNAPETVVLEITQAFVKPIVHFAARGGSGWQNYCTLIAHLGVQKFWIDNTVSTKYDVHALEFIQALKEVFPHATELQIHCCFQFLLSVTLYAVCDNQRLDTLSQGKFKSKDLELIEPHLYQFVVKGILGTIL